MCRQRKGVQGGGGTRDNIPATEVLIKGSSADEHIGHIRYARNIPVTNILIKGSSI
ncbi:hypothetical protein SPONL_1059 [uncultured Candidatus Thioglobus sp.]|nr:hypothetical protein SPONL_1059 [uncultured Candidatus Thioglobus sp.]